MSTAGRTGGQAPTASDVAAACREAGLVRFVATADGDALAATGVLARACAATDTPFQASVVPLARAPDAATAGTGTGTEADCTVTVGASGGDVSLVAEPLSRTAYAAAAVLTDDADPVLALAGTVAAGHAPGEDDVGLLAAAEERGVARRPGVATPTADLADGLAHGTLLHAPFSGDERAATETVSALDLPESLEDADHRRVASMVALAVVEPDAAGPRAATAVERALAPLDCGGGDVAPFATVGGYADVLDAAARRRPGTGVALALGHGTRETALDAWRTHGRAAHRALRTADTGRYDGLYVVRPRSGDEGPPPPVVTVARLARDFRSPEPVVLVVGDGEAAAAAVDGDPTEPLSEAVAATGDGAVGGRGTVAHATGIDGTNETAFVGAVREALA